MNKLIYSIIFVLFALSNLMAQYSDAVHMKYFEYYFLKEYALREIFNNDKNIIKSRKVKSSITTDSSGNVLYDSMKFDEAGNIFRHVTLESNLRNDFDGDLSFNGTQRDIIFNVSPTGKGNEKIFSQNEVWHFTGFIKRDSSYKIFIAHDTLKYYFNSFIKVGNFYKVEHFLPGYEQINQLIQIRQFRGKTNYDNIDTRLIYSYDTDKKINKLICMYDKEEFWYITVEYKPDAITFTSSDYNPAISDGAPGWRTETFIFENGRIFRKQVTYPVQEEDSPVYINTEYHYKDNGLIDFTVTDYAENSLYNTLNERTYKEGTFAKYYQYEFYK